MELDNIRKEINVYDNIIKNMITLRMALIPIVADKKIKNNLPLFQGKREEEIYKNIEVFANENGVDANLLKDIYKLIIGNALKTEENIAKTTEKSVLSNNIDIAQNKTVVQEFEKLDNIIQKEIPEILENIKKQYDVENLNLSEIASLYYSNIL